MEDKIYKPYFDKLYWITLIPTVILVLDINVLAFFDTYTLFITLPTAVFVAYFFVSPFFGYARLGEDSLYIKFGFILKKEIPYCKIRGVERQRRIYSDSMLSLKNSLDHVNVKYNSFDVTSLSLVDSEDFIKELKKRCNI